MGEVFAARSLSDGAAVALKTLRVTHPTHIYRFKREFRALADVRHPNLVRLHDLGFDDEDGHNYFTMELVEGQPFVAWVRAHAPTGERPDFARLERALAQLIAGVARLHANATIHRDLKPSNVLVESTGRVVVLDFGLIREPEVAGITTEGQLLGTPLYMAPEQAAGQVAEAASDVYAIGLMLLECLCGALPYEGSVIEVLAAKRGPLRLDRALDGVPPHLAQLCRSMLAHDPKERPTLDEVAARLPLEPANFGLHVEHCVGRDEILTTFEDLARDLERDLRVRVVQLRGPSGQGKSTILRRVRHQLGGRGYLCLHGRCGEREAVPYKGIDALIDELSIHLRALSTADRTRLRPSSISALLRVFPIFAGLWPGASDRELQPAELRAASCTALIELLGGLASERPLLLMLDDFQWTDLDSVAVLEAIVARVANKALLIVIALRDDIEPRPPALEILADSAGLGRDAAHLRLGPLDSAASYALASVFARGRSESWIRSVALRSHGNPLFITQAALGIGRADAIDDLDALVRRRIADLDDRQRALVQLIAVAGGPVEEELARELCPIEDAKLVGLLEARILVRGQTPFGLELETEHALIREIVRGSLSEEARAERHRNLGEALSLRAGPDPDDVTLYRLATHLHAGLGGAELDDAHRQEYVAQFIEVGYRAHASTALDLARRYFDSAAQLAAPWLDGDPPPTDAQRMLCRRLLWGQARAYYDSPHVDEIHAALERLGLPVAQLAELARERSFGLALRGRPDAARTSARAMLEQFGYRIPRRARLAWALWQVTRGRLAIRRSLARGSEPARVADEPRAILEFVGMCSALWLTSNEQLIGFGLAGIHAREVAKLGLPRWASDGLVAFSYVLLMLGKQAECDALRTNLQQRELLSKTNLWHEIGTLQLAPRTRPLAALLDELERVHATAVKAVAFHLCVALRGTVATIMLDVDLPLPEVITKFEMWQSATGHYNELEYERAANLNVDFARALIDGLGPETLAPQPFEVPILAATRVIRRMQLCALRQDYAQTWALAAPLARNFERVLLGVYLTPLYATLAAVGIAGCWAQLGPKQHRRLRRTLAQHRRLLTRWASDCPETFAPMLTLIDAEIAATSGQHDLAMQHYEAAHHRAVSSRMLWLAGLAAHRLALMASTRERTFMAQGALQSVRDCYTRWGAQSLVVMLAAGPTGQDQRDAGESVDERVSSRSSTIPDTASGPG